MKRSAAYQGRRHSYASVGVPAKVSAGVIAIHIASLNAKQAAQLSEIIRRRRIHPPGPAKQGKRLLGVSLLPFAFKCDRLAGAILGTSNFGLRQFADFSRESVLELLDLILQVSPFGSVCGFGVHELLPELLHLVGELVRATVRRPSCMLSPHDVFLSAFSCILIKMSTTAPTRYVET